MKQSEQKKEEEIGEIIAVNFMVRWSLEKH